jgi:hypothetical protein
MMDEQNRGQQDGGASYRETATWLRDIAGECRLAGERDKFLQLAALLERRADQLDRRQGSAISVSCAELRELDRAP